jgi:hypothetical protein
MTDVKTLLSDPRRRNLAVLAGVALVSILLALFGLHERAAETAPQYEQTEFFPGLAAHVRDAAHIRIASKKNGSFDIVFVPEKGWVLPARGDYPASFEQVRGTLVGLAALETIEPKTARADWLHYLSLDAPDHGGDGVLITVSDDKGREIASLIAGKSEDIGDQTGAVGLFVRRPDETQSYLVRSVFEPRSDPADWIDKNVMDVDRARIREADIDPASGPSYEVRRQTPADADFALSPLPAGRALANPAAPDGVAAAIVGFTFDDIRPAKNIDFTNAGRVVTRTFDGLVVTVNTVQQGQDIWAQVSADAEPEKPDAAKEARSINAHAEGWAYKLPDYKGAQFMTTLESLLQPAAAAHRAK